MPKKDLLTLRDMSAEEILSLLDRAEKLKQWRVNGQNPQTLKGKVLVAIFEKPSTRTKVSFEVAMFELGGHVVNLETSSSQLGRGETYADTARVLSRYAHGIMIRTFRQEDLEELAREATIPVINGLTDEFHPCQVLTDLLTVKEAGLDLGNFRAAYIGDGNNMTHSWMMAAKQLGFSLNVATPKNYGPQAWVVEQTIGDNIRIGHDVVEAVTGVDVICTDTWFSMGQEVSEEKKNAFLPFQLNEDLLSRAAKNAIVLHCLPAHRGEEITGEVMDGRQSRVWDEAENRLHVQKAILEQYLNSSRAGEFECQK